VDKLAAQVIWTKLIDNARIEDVTTTRDPSRPRVDVHQHVWTEPLLAELQARTRLPFVRVERDLTVLHLARERPYVIEVDAETRDRRARLLASDGVDRALVCLSSPLGIEALPRAEAEGLIEAYHRGALALGPRFGVWGALALAEPDPDDVDRLLEAGCVGLALPAGALAGIDSLQRLDGVLERLSVRGAPLFVHPGPGLGPCLESAALSDPLWWPGLTRYVADMQEAWLAFAAVGRRAHPSLRVIFAMLAGLAPLHFERLSARGGPDLQLDDPLVFYETSSYGDRAVAQVCGIAGEQQVLYGSDRPVVDPQEQRLSVDEQAWSAYGAATDRALGGLRSERDEDRHRGELAEADLREPARGASLASAVASR
jgi:6-methylsalicylate decarboxylase